MDNGASIKCKELVNLFILMILFIKANFMIISRRDSEHILNIMEKFMKVIGLEIGLMGKEKKFMLMELYMKVNLRMALKMDMENIQ